MARKCAALTDVGMPAAAEKLCEGAIETSSSGNRFNC